MRQFRDWRFLKGKGIEPPAAYLDYVLCHHVYHCTPDRLDAQDALTVDLHLEFWSEEQKAQSSQKRLTKGKRRRG